VTEDARTKKNSQSQYFNGPSFFSKTNIMELFPFYFCKRYDMATACARVTVMCDKERES